MALSREQTNALARHVIKTVQPQEQPQSKHAALLAAFQRLDEPLPPRLRPIDPAERATMMPEQLAAKHPNLAGLVLPPSDE
jgi:hypothetical protein